MVSKAVPSLKQLRTSERAAGFIKRSSDLRCMLDTAVGLPKLSLYSSLRTGVQRRNKASGAFGALRKELFGTKYASCEAKRKAYTGIVLNVLLFGCESWCLTADLVGTLASWHHARLREMCRVTMSFTNALESRASNTIFACARCVG